MEKLKSQNKSLAISLVAAAVLMGSFIVLQRWFETWDEKLVSYEKYEVAPEFKLELQKHVEPSGLAGKQFAALQDFKGKTILLHFWASWCKPCREEKPMLQELVDQHKDGTLTVIGVASYESAASLQGSGLLPETPFTVLLDEEGTIALAYKIRAIPQSVLIDGQGRIRYRVKGALTRQEIKSLDAALITIREEEAHQSTAVNL